MLSLAPLKEGDIAEISSAFAAIGWNKPAEQYRSYLDECSSGARVVLVARWDGLFAGYGTLLHKSGIPEIADLNVLPQLQRRGVGSRLMEELETIAARSSDVVGIAVGLTPDYDAAQCLYVQRGYVPDGRGAYSHNAPLKWGDTIVADDSLVLHLVKSLRTNA